MFVSLTAVPMAATDHAVASAVGPLEPMVHRLRARYLVVLVSFLGQGASRKLREAAEQLLKGG